LSIKNGLTPLHLCAQEDKVNVASILVDNNANINATTKVRKLNLFYLIHIFIYKNLNALIL